MSSATPFDRQIHRRLLDGDLTASAELAEAYLEEIVRQVRIRTAGRRRFSVVKDETVVQDAAVDAFLNYVDRPDQYNPAKKSLLDYLVMSARGDLVNALRKEERHILRLTPLEGVEHSPRDRKRIQEADAEQAPPLTGGIDATTRDALWQRVLEVIPDERDRRLLSLRLDGVRNTEPYAAVLCLDGLPRTRQRAIVKQHKDRLDKRLERLGVKLRERARE